MNKNCHESSEEMVEENVEATGEVNSDSIQIKKRVGKKKCRLSDEVYEE